MTGTGRVELPALLSPNEIKDRFCGKEIDRAWSFKECKLSDTSKWTHGYHRYPAKFIPQLVEKLFDEYITAPEAKVNDPFMGCGTTIVSAVARGYHASGTDVNRIAYLITKVKSTPIPPERLDKSIEKFLSDLRFMESERAATHPKIKPLIPETHLERIDYWFPEKTKIELGTILRRIRSEEDEFVREFLLVAFSHILKSCSVWLQGSTKPTKDSEKQLPKPISTLKRHLAKMQRGNAALYAAVPASVKNNPRGFVNIRVGDARTQPAAEASVDLVVTSSPYVTSYEYADLHQLSTIWLDLAENLAEYKEQFIGTSRKRMNGTELHTQIAREIVLEMANQNERMAREIEAYFVDMQQVFAESLRILKRGGRACFVIGNTKLRGVEILNAQVFAETLQHRGFVFDRLIKREIPSKILPQKRDEKTGRFASHHAADVEAYPIEYIVIGLKQ